MFTNIKTYYPDERDYNLGSLAYERKGDGICVAYYNTPKNLHALTPNQQHETFLVLEYARRDPACKVLIWTATGQRAFSSGAAFGVTQVDLDPEVAAAYRAKDMCPKQNDVALKTMTLAFWDFPKPIIMAINGLAVGGGANIALMNYGDMVLASTKARFMWPFAKLGLSPELGSSLMMAQIIGMPRAKRIMMLGEWLSAEDAHSMGLVNEVVEPDELMPRAMELAKAMTAFTPDTMLRIKDIMNKHLRESMDKVLDDEAVTLGDGIKQLMMAAQKKKKGEAKM
jgi:enoyl-CoA hydratase/carnithine racemase